MRLRHRSAYLIIQPISCITFCCYFLFLQHFYFYINWASVSDQSFCSVSSQFLSPSVWHLDLGLSLSFSFMLKTFFGILPCSFLQLSHSSLFCFLLMYFPVYSSLNSLIFSEADSTKENWDRYYWEAMKRTFSFGSFIVWWQLDHNSAPLSDSRNEVWWRRNKIFIIAYENDWRGFLKLLYYAVVWHGWPVKQTKQWFLQSRNFLYQEVKASVYISTLQCSLFVKQSFSRGLSYSRKFVISWLL